MSLFPTITGADWTRGLAHARSTANSISAQIRANLLPADHRTPSARVALTEGEQVGGQSNLREGAAGPLACTETAVPAPHESILRPPGAAWRAA